MAQRWRQSFEFDVVSWCIAQKAGLMKDAVQVLKAGQGRKALEHISSNAFSMLPGLEYAELMADMGHELMQQCEWAAARTCCFIPGMVTAAALGAGNAKALQLQLECAVAIASCQFREIRANGVLAEHFPRAMAAQLECLKLLEHVIISICQMAAVDQTKLVWLLRQAIHHTIEMAEPFLRCGSSELVTRYFTGALLAMEAVPALSTVRHAKLRLKLYTLLAQCFILALEWEQVEATVRQAAAQIRLLREIEESDPPLQPQTEQAFREAEADIMVLRCVAQSVQHGKFSISPEQAAHRAQILLELLRMLGLCTSIPALINHVEDLQNEIVKYLMELDQSALEELCQQPLLCAELLALAPSTELLDKLVSCRSGDPADIQLPEAVATSSPHSSNLEETLLTLALTVAKTLQTIPESVSKVPPEVTMRTLSKFSDRVARVLATEPRAALLGQSMLLRSVVAITCSGVIPVLRSYEGSSQSSPMRLSTESREVLVTIYRILILLVSEDLLRVGGVVIRIARLLSEHGDIVTALAMANDLAEAFSAARAQHAELAMIAPAEYADFAALQQISLTTVSDLEDWFSGKRRAGATGSQGMSIFGAESTIFQLDQAIADMHLDLNYLRTTLELQRALGRAQASSPKKVQFAESSASSPTPLPLTTSDKRREFSQAVSTLRKEYRENHHLRAVLAMCVAGFCSNDDAIITHLEEAERELHAAEQYEQSLLLHHHIGRVSSSHAVVSSAPVVLTVSSRCAYVCPNVASIRRLSKASRAAATAVAVFGKAYGAGTAVSVKNDSLPGLGQKLPLNGIGEFSELTDEHPIVRVQLLEANEAFVFATAAFDAHGTLLGSISDTCSKVVAADALPSVLLWAYLAQKAHAANHKQIALAAARHVCGLLTSTVDLQWVSSRGRWRDRRHVSAEQAVQLRADQLWSLSRGRATAFSVCNEILAQLAVSHPRQPTDCQRMFLGELRRTVLAVEVAAAQGDMTAVLDGCRIGYEHILRTGATNAYNLVWCLRDPLQALTTAMLIAASNSEVLWKHHHSELLLRLAAIMANVLVTQGDFVTLHAFLESLQSAVLDRLTDDQLNLLQLILRNGLPCKIHEFEATPPFTHRSPENSKGCGATSSLPPQSEIAKWLDDTLAGNGTSSKLSAAFPKFTQSFCQKACLAGAVLRLARLRQGIKLSQFSTLVDAIAFQDDWQNASAELQNVLVEWKLTVCLPTSADDDEAHGGDKHNEQEFPSKFELSPPDEQCVVGEQLRAETIALGLMCAEYASLWVAADPATAFSSSRLSHKGPFTWRSTGAGMSDLESEANSDTTPSWLQALAHATAALWLFSEANLLAAAEDTAVLVWRLLVKNWTTPAQFSACCEATLLGRLVRAMASFAGRIGQQSSRVEPADPWAPQLNSRSTMLMVFVAECLFHKQHWSVLVWFGQQLQVLWSSPTSELETIALGTVYQRTEHAQQEIVEAAQATLKGHQEALSELTQAWKQFLATQKGPKVRVRTEKSMQELEFEERQNNMLDKVTAAQGALSTQLEVLSTIQQAKSLFEASSNSAAALVRLVRQQCRDCIDSFINDQRTTGGQALLPDWMPRVQEIVAKFHKVAHVLRGKGERALLLACLQELGDFCVFWQDRDQAQQAYTDAIDGYFNKYQTVSCWRTVLAERKAPTESSGRLEEVGASLTVVSVLWKLNEFVHSLREDECMNNALFAAELARSVFSDSLGHPVELVDYALYNASDMPVLQQLVCSTASVQFEAVRRACWEHSRMLLQSPQPIRALPLSCLQDYLSRNVLCNEQHVLHSRMQRVEILSKVALFSEGVQMVWAIVRHPATEQLKVQPTDIVHPSLPAFAANLEADHEDNLRALSAICQAAKGVLRLLTASQEPPAVSVAPAAAPKAKRSNTTKTAAKLSEPSFSSNAALDAWLPTAAQYGPGFMAPFVLCCCSVVVGILACAFRASTSSSSALLGVRKEVWDVVHELRKATAEPGKLVRLIRVDEIIVRLLLMQRSLRKAKAHALAGIVLVEESSSSSMTPRDRKELIMHWLHCKFVYSDCLLRQGNYTASIRIACSAESTAEAIVAGFWTARFQVLKAKALRMAGDLGEALPSLQLALRWYSGTQLHCSTWVEALCLRSSLQRELLDRDESTAVPLHKALQQVHAETHEAIEVARTAAELGGWLGADNPMTTVAPLDNVFDLVQLQLQGVAIPPVLHARLPAPNGHGVSQVFTDNDADKLCSMPLVNCYLPECIQLCAAYAVRLAIAQETIALLAGRAEASTELFAMLTQQTYDDSERAMRCMRYAVHLPPVVRAYLLFYAGLSRLQNPDAKIKQQTVSALRGCLEVAAHRAPYLRSLMYRACLALVEAFGQHAEDDGDAGHDDEENAQDAVMARLSLNSRLQLAMQMQQLAAEIHSQCYKLDSRLFQYFDSKLLDTKLPDLVPVLVEFDGKSAAASPTLRTALLHVRRLQSHADQLYLLEGSYSPLDQLHAQLVQSSPEYAACCVGPVSIGSLSNLSLPAAVTAVEGSVCATCWHGWNGTFPDRVVAENLGNEGTDSITMYFLLGPVTLAQASSSGFEAGVAGSAELPHQFPEPYLAKAELNQGELKRMTGDVVKLRLQLSTGVPTEALTTDMQCLLDQLSRLFGCEHAELTVRLSEEVLEAIQSVFDHQSSSGTCVDHALCYLLRMLLLQL